MYRQVRALFSPFACLGGRGLWSAYERPLFPIFGLFASYCRPIFVSRGLCGLLLPSARRRSSENTCHCPSGFPMLKKYSWRFRPRLALSAQIAGAFFSVFSFFFVFRSQKASTASRLELQYH